MRCDEICVLPPSLMDLPMDARRVFRGHDKLNMDLSFSQSVSCHGYYLCLLPLDPYLHSQCIEEGALDLLDIATGHGPRGKLGECAGKQANPWRVQ